MDKKVLSQYEQLQVKQFLEGVPVIEIISSDIQLKDDSKASRNLVKKEAIERARKSEKMIISTIDGDIIFDVSGVKKSLGHTINQDKIDALPFIPEGIKKGMTIDVSDDLNQPPRPIKYLHKALPVKTESNNDLLIIRIRQAKGQDSIFYDHALYRLSKLKEKGDPYNQPPVANSGYNPDSQEAGHKGTAYIKNILHNILNIKVENDEKH